MKTYTTKQTAEILNLSRVRCLGLAKAGKLVATKSNIPGTDIPHVMFDADSVDNYVPSRSNTMRAMIVKLPSDKLDMLETFCRDNGFELKVKNAKHETYGLYTGEEDNEEDFEEVEAA
jgi:hypothetical protein